MNEKKTSENQTKRDIFLSQSSKTILKIDDLIEKRRETKMSKIKSFYRYIFNKKGK